MIRTCENVTFENFKPKIRKFKKFKILQHNSGARTDDLQIFGMFKKSNFWTQIANTRDSARKKKPSNAEQYLNVNRL